MGAMFVGGVSTARVGQLIEGLTGSKPSASPVSRVFHTLESEYAQWKTRKLCERYAFADGTYFTVISKGQGCKMPLLAVIGIPPTGERDVLTFRIGDRENQMAWEDLLEDLKERGIKEMGWWVSDSNQAMRSVITKKIPASARQRCVVHQMDNVLSYIPNKQQDQIKPELCALFSQKDRAAADQAVAALLEKYQKTYPTAIECLQRDLDACLTLYALPKEYGRLLATLWRSETSFAQNGGGFSDGRELFTVVSCCYSQSQVEYVDHATCISGSTRP